MFKAIQQSFGQGKSLNLKTCKSTYDFSTLYSTLHHNLIKEKLTDLIERMISLP